MPRPIPARSIWDRAATALPTTCRASCSRRWRAWAYCTCPIGVAPAIADLLGGQVQVIFGTMPAVIALIKSGRLRALGVTTATRSNELPDVPSIGEFVPGYEASQWYGIGAPKGTPADVIERLNRETNAVLADPKMQARLAELGASALAGSPADFGKLIVDETAKWAKVVKISGAKPD